MNKAIERILKTATKVGSKVTGADLCYRDNIEGKMLIISGVHGVWVDDDPTVECDCTTDRHIPEEIRKEIQHGLPIDLDVKELKAEAKKRGCKRSSFNNTTYTLAEGCSVNIHYLIDVMEAVDGHTAYWSGNVKRRRTGEYYPEGMIVVDGHKGQGVICPVATKTKVVVPTYPKTENS